ncbi:MAG TPA: glycosyltransferase family 2 protein [Candidatus Xenobia bacterium]|nr:glycosyltransferase family 2 protein [Candidatus Xenobia bacterium]
MQLALTIVLALAALVWVVGGGRALRGIFRMPRLADFPPLPDTDCPPVSMLVTARDEAAKLPQAITTWLDLDYPRLEIVAIDDRSKDATGRILDEAAARDPRLKVVHLTELPPGWLGKNHGLQTAYRHSAGEWLLFTDADVRFDSDVLRRTMALARARTGDHVSLLSLIELKGFWENVMVSYFFLGFLLNLQPWEAENPRSPYYVGIGAFQLIRRSVYEDVGTHKRLALEVVDDVKLGKMVKQGGYRSVCAQAFDNLRVRWQEGATNVIKGLTKNAFASLEFNSLRTALSVAAIAMLSVLPFAALLFARGLPLHLATIAVAAILVLHGVTARRAHLSPLTALTHPLGAVLFAYILIRSTVVTLGRGGVVWRDTFYSLDELRKGLV